MCKLSIARLLAFVMACGAVIHAMPSQAEDQKPSVEIVTKPKVPLGDVTKPANPEDLGIVKKPPIDLSNTPCPQREPYNECRNHQLWRCKLVSPHFGNCRPEARCENSGHPC
jgi:hypothetical protein